MPTMKTRVNLTLDDTLVAAIDRIRAITGQPRTAVIMEVLEPSTPYFEQMAQMLEEAQQQKAQPSVQLMGNLEEVTRRVASGYGDLSPRARKLMEELLLEMSSEQSGGTGPRPVTRGPEFDSHISSKPLSIN